MTTPTPLVVGTDLHRAFGRGDGRVVALDGVDIAVAPGELMVIRGPSGCGKSTLLHCLSGIMDVDAGRVTYPAADGGEVVLQDLDDDARTDLRAERMGFVFQTLNLLPALSARENVELPLVLAGLPAGEIHPRVDAALAAVGLPDRDRSAPADLSGGQQQRIALARALVGEPQIIWADEPTGALDTAAQDEMLALLRQAVTPQRAVVVVSHADAVADAADRVVHMRDGRIED